MAATDALQRKPASLQRAVFTDRLGRILRTTGGKPAMIAKERAEQKLVGPDQELEQFSHGLVTLKVALIGVNTCRQAEVRL